MNEGPDAGSGFFGELNHQIVVEAKRLGLPVSLDVCFLTYLKKLSRFGFFNFGPINIDVHLIEDIVEATATVSRGPEDSVEPPPMSEDMVAFSHVLMDEMRRSNRRRLDELHYLLAFMRTSEGLPYRVFSELGVRREQVEAFARAGQSGPAPLEKLYSPEEAAEYLNIHVQTVRGWIRSGRLRARRLAGQRALRVTASDLQSVLEPLSPDDKAGR